jgi:hypothetical protein
MALAIIDTVAAGESVSVIDGEAVRRHAIVRLGTGASDVYVGTNPDASAVYVGTVEEVHEMFGENLANLIPLGKYESWSVGQITWQVSVN